MTTDVAIWWLRTAIGDLAAAELLLGPNGVATYRHPAYFAQQAAEKAIKATISLEGEPPVTHDLVRLVARRPEQARMPKIDFFALAAPHTAARYPELDEAPYTRTEAEQLVADAAAVVGAVRAYLDEVGILNGRDLSPI